MKSLEKTTTSLAEKRIQSPLSEQEMISYKYISDIGDRALIHTANVYKLIIEKLSDVVGVGTADAPVLNLVDGEDAKLSITNEVPEIVLGKNEFIRDTAETLSEEFGHYLRFKLTNKLLEGGKEYLTDEFFGFLSRRLVFEKLDEEQRGLLFPDGIPSLESTYEEKSKGDITKELREKGKIKRALDKEYKLAEEKDDTDKMNEIAKKAEEGGVKKWFRTITHYRGYQFASRVDLGRIIDWNKLYSLSDKEVRMRFFTPNPDYTGL